MIGRVTIPSISEPFTTTGAQVSAVANKFLAAVKLAGRIYRHIAATKGVGNYSTEVSMDESDRPKLPPELLLILAALADEQIPLQAIAPKFTGRFNKGVDYVGDVAHFECEFNDGLAVIAHAVQQYWLPSIRSGSDKFSIYGRIKRALNRAQRRGP